jgi:hypothetical protein
MLIGLSLLVLLVAAVPGFAAPQQPEYWSNWVTTSGGGSWTGWWDAAASNWVPAGGIVTGVQNLSVDAYVEMYAKTTLESQATFHWGLPPFAAQTAHVLGTCVQNHPCWIGVSKANWSQTEGNHLGYVDGSGTGQKPQSEGFGPALNDTNANIPIAWGMKVGTDATIYPMAWTGGLNQANWGFYSPGRFPVGSTSYEIQITATPDAYQADGRYTLDPEVVVVPDM